MDILIYGTINSVSLALIAIGFTLVYGISRLPNFAHGALYVANGFIVWSLLNILQLNYILSIILSLIITGMIGAAISEIIASYAIGLAILEGFSWSGFKGMTYTLPVFIEGSIEIAGIPVDFQRILAVLIGGLVIFLLWLFTHYNRIGLALRCMAQDERAAMMLGIDSDRMALIAMALGSILAG